MRIRLPRWRTWRKPTIEQLEQRHVMSADPFAGLFAQSSLLAQAGSAASGYQAESPEFVEYAADFWLNPMALGNTDPGVREIEQMFAEADALSGLTQVRSDYGLIGSGQTVAVIDSGVAWNHSALGGGLGSGYRVVGGWDFAEGDANPYDDGAAGGHGTLVTGVIGTDRTGTADDGVAVGADIVSLRIFDDSGNSYYAWLESALQWVHQNRNTFENPITTVSISLGDANWNSNTVPGWSTIEDELLQLKNDGIFISVSAGNAFQSFNAAGLTYPASSPHVIPAMSADNDGALTYYSQRHSRGIAAPGRSIVSTVPDYLGNNNGVADDFASYSGTSMAAPYLAGASMLVREAMQVVGMTNITQTTIYNHLVATADTLYDSATSQWYNRLNLEAAIDALMPSDDFGSTAGTAHNLGTLSGTSQINGIIGSLSDVDFFTFTAGSTGSVTVTAEPTHELVPDWTGSGGANGNTYTISVVAGHTYTFGLSTNAGIGSYDLTLNSGGPATNDAPVLGAIGNRTVNEGSLLTFTASATDGNAGQTLTYSLAAGAPAGATINATTGVFSWTPTEAQGPGSFSVTVRVTDNGSPALSDSETITITVNEVNVAPVLAAIGNRSVNEGSLLTFTASATDADSPAQTRTYSLDAGAPAGATINATTGVFSWTPTEAQGPGSFSVTVRVTDNGSPALSDSETITITVNEVNVAPVLAAIGNRSVNEGSLLTFTASATDADSPAQTRTYSLDAGAPAGATINATTGVFSWTPTEAQGPGSFSVTVRVTDNGSPALSDSETITITVNEVNVAPVLAAIGNRSVNEGSLLTFTASATDADSPAQTRTYSLDAGAPAGATINATTGVFSWTPTEAQGPGSFSVTVRVTDNGSPALSDFETITITVNEVNAAPVLAAIGNRSVVQGSLLTFTASATDSDSPAQTRTYSLDAGAPAGATINATTGVFSWTPSVSQALGNYSVTVRVTDSGSPAQSDFETITVSVTNVSVAPVLGAIGNRTVNEGSLLTFTASATDGNAGQTLTYSLAAGAPAGATINATTGVFSWTPTEAQGPGSFSVTVRVTDNGSPALSDFETITITVNEVNAAPVLAAIGNRTVNEGSLLTFTASATDADSPAQTRTYSLDAGAPAGATINATTGVFSWTPTEAQGPGSFSVTVRVTDNGSPALSDSETITITVNEVNVAPVLAAIGNRSVNEGSLLTFTASATDADSPAQTRTYSLDAGAPAGATINATTGVFSWTPTEAQGPGSFSVTVRVTDNGSPALSDSETITITVNEVNVAPVLAAIGNRSVNEGSLLTFTASATDADSPAQTRTYSLDAGAPAGATINATTGVFSWTPTEAQGPGSFSVTVRVTDNGSPALSDSETITITVNEVNVAPVLAAIGNRSVVQGSLLTFTASATDSDSPAQTRTYSLDAGAPAGATINATTGVFSWTPSVSQALGNYSVTVRVTDSGSPAQSDFETITVSVVASVVQEVRYFSTTTPATPTSSDGSSISISSADIAMLEIFNGGQYRYRMVLDGSDVGLGGAGVNIDAFTMLSDGSILVSTAGAFGVYSNYSAGVGSGAVLTGTGSDLLRYIPTGVGDDTSGMWSIYFRGANVGLTAITEDIDGVAALSDGRLLISTTGSVSVPGATGSGEDIFLFTPSALGGATQGAWGLYFDGSDVGLSGTSENIDGINVREQAGMLPKLYLSTTSAFSVTNVHGYGEDVITFQPNSLGGSTQGAFGVGWDGSQHGLAGLNVDGIYFTTPPNGGGGNNSSPTIAAIGNRTVNEGSLLSFAVNASDANAGQTLKYNLAAGAPAGATIDSSSGVFTWNAQGPGAYSVTVLVSDNGWPILYAAQTFTITVVDVNVAPTLVAIGNKSVVKGGTLNFAVNANDADLPANTLTYSLEAGAPAGATINSATGAFSWTPSANQAPGTYTATIRVTDNGSPALSDFETINIEVEAIVVQDVRYFSMSYDWFLYNSNGGGLAATSSDIAKYEKFNGGQYQYRMQFDGSDVGLAGLSENIDAFTFLADGSILVSTAGAFSVSANYATAGVGSGAILSGTAQDLLRFTPTSLGDNTAGTWSFYFRGANVGLTTSAENIDGLSVLADGRLLISTSGGVSVPGAKGEDEDILLFTPTALGVNTSGAWGLFFDGSDVGLTKANEDIDAFHVHQQAGSLPTINLSTLGDFSVAGAGGTGADVVAFRLGSIGGSTSGVFGPGLSLIGSQNGMSAGNSIDGLYLGAYPGPLGSAGSGAGLPDESLPVDLSDSLRQPTLLPMAIGAFAPAAAIDTSVPAGHQLTFQAVRTSAPERADQLLTLVAGTQGTEVQEPDAQDSDASNLVKTGEADENSPNSKNSIQEEFEQLNTLSATNVDRVFGAW